MKSSYGCRSFGSNQLKMLLCMARHHNLLVSIHTFALANYIPGPSEGRLFSLCLLAALALWWHVVLLPLWATGRGLLQKPAVRWKVDGASIKRQSANDAKTVSANHPLVAISERAACTVANPFSASCPKPQRRYGEAFACVFAGLADEAEPSCKCALQPTAHGPWLSQV